MGEEDALEEEYRRFAKPVFEKMVRADPGFVANREDKFLRINSVLMKFRDSSERIEYSPDDRDRRENVGKVLDEMLGSTRGGDFKQATPFRKKKSTFFLIQISTNATTNSLRYCKLFAIRTWEWQARTFPRSQRRRLRPSPKPLSPRHLPQPLPILPLLLSPSNNPLSRSIPYLMKKADAEVARKGR